MKGKYLHSSIIAALLLKALRLRGYHARTEYPVRQGPHQPAVDIYFHAARLAIAIEIELTLARIRNDLAKAKALNAGVFLIVLPDARTARAAKSRVVRLRKAMELEGVTIQVMHLGTALQWIANNCPVVTAPDHSIAT